jgi:hypothetical protein
VSITSRNKGHGYAPGGGQTAPGAPKRLFVTAFRDNRSLRTAQDILRRFPPKRFVLASAADEADVILYIEEGYLGLTDLPAVLDTINSAPRAAHYVFSECDWPYPFLPGAYPSLSRLCRWADSWSFLPKIALMAAHLQRPLESPPYLYSFLGRRETHKIREAILSLDGPATPCVDLADGPARFPNFDYAETYLRVIAESKFVLCPRGYGASSFRIFEAMALSRAPVIISDAWQPPPNIAWDRFCVFVPQRDVAKIPSLLRAHEERAEAMGQIAGAIHAQHFAPDVFFDRLVTWLCDSRAGAAFNAEATLARACQAIGWREIWSLGSQTKTRLADAIRKYSALKQL